MNINDLEKEVEKQIQNTDTETKEIQNSKSKTSFENSLSIFSANSVNNQIQNITVIMPDQNTSNYKIQNTFVDINIDIARNSSETNTMEKATDVSHVHKSSDVSGVHKSTDVSDLHKSTDVSDTHKSTDVSGVHKSTEVSDTHKSTDVSDAHKSKWMRY